MTEDTDDQGAGKKRLWQRMQASFEDEIICVKLQLPEHMAAYREKRNLDRDIEPLACDDSLMEKVTANYIISKKIISNLTWQERFLCKNVCNLWQLIVQTLQLEQLWLVDYSLSIRSTNVSNGIKFLKSSNYTEPLAVLLFSNRLGFVTAARCESLVPCPCDPCCEKEHYTVDIVNRDVAGPTNCMLTVKAGFLTYLPLPQSITYENAIRYLDAGPIIGGISIPAIPNVKFTIINIESMNLLQKVFYEDVDKLAETHYIKGVLVFAKDSYLLQSVEDIVFLNHLEHVQPSVPYALGGCMIEDIMSDPNDLTDRLNENKHFTSDNLITIALFSVPKNLEPDDTSNFDMFSLILESCEWTKNKIQSSILEFSKKVPHFKHSVAIKLSSLGRDEKHELEQQSFRQAFPTTPLIGCYGNGELGINHPIRPRPKEFPLVKRHCRDPGPKFGVVYSYSTVFVYIGWGTILGQSTSN